MSPSLQRDLGNCYSSAIFSHRAAGGTPDEEVCPEEKVACRPSEAEFASAVLVTRRRADASALAGPSEVSLNIRVWPPAIPVHEIEGRLRTSHAYEDPCSSSSRGSMGRGGSLSWSGQWLSKAPPLCVGKRRITLDQNPCWR